MFKFLSILFLAVSLSSCGGGGAGGGAVSNGASGDSTYTVNGIEVNKAYSQFHYYKEGDCKKRTMKFNYVVLPANKNQTINLFLKPNGEAMVVLNASHTIATRWRIEETRMVVDGFGVANYLSYNNRPAIKFEVVDSLSYLGTYLVSRTVNYDQKEELSRLKDEFVIADAKESCEKAVNNPDSIFKFVENF